MYYLKEKGIWPFRKLKLVEKVTPRHREEVVKSPETMLVEQYQDAISSVTIDKNGFIRLNVGRQKAKNIVSFEIVDGCVVYKDNENRVGLITRNGKIIDPDRGNSYITEVTVANDVAIYREVSKRSRAGFYTIHSTKNGEPLLIDSYARVKFGDKERGIKGNVIFLTAHDGLKTVATTRGDILAIDCIKYDKLREHLLVLSYTDKEKEKTALEGFVLERGATPRQTFLRPEVKDFDAGFDELIAHIGKGSTVYKYTGKEDNCFEMAFSARGRVSNFSPLFSRHTIYTGQEDGHMTLIDKDGNVSRNPDLDHLMGIELADDNSLITCYKKDGRMTQGLVRSSDFATILPPVYHKVRMFGDKTCVGSAADTFAIYKLDEVVDGVYSQNPREIVPMQQYFNPQMTNKKGVLLCEDAMGIDCVLTADKSKVIVEKAEEYVEKEQDPYKDAGRLL